MYFVFLFVGTLVVRREFVWCKFSYNVLDIQQVCGTSSKLQTCDALKETGTNIGIQKWTKTRQQIKISCLHNLVIPTDFFVLFPLVLLISKAKMQQCWQIFQNIDRICT